MNDQQLTISNRWAGPYLKVAGAPFLVLGAEVHNSSSSTAAVITESFTTVARLGANTVLAPVAWDRFEPVEGQFDYHLVYTMITTARTLGLCLIPLWFGTWKNAISTYAPGWVKTDTDRFPRAETAAEGRIEHVSAFASAARNADARAFGRLMRHIRHTDHDGTVIAVQIENEMGLLGDSRDRSPLAETAFTDTVPPAVVEAVAANPDMPLHRNWQLAGAPQDGTWTTMFADGEHTDEVFMAAAFASYTEAVAAAGAAEHDIPMFVNAWLNADSVLDGPVAVAGGKRPGDYPSGGPVLSVAPLWEALAPTLHFIAPDVYVDDAEPIFAGYRSRRGRLFIPELRADALGIAQMFAAVGSHRALGACPFGVDALDPELPESHALTDAFGLLSAAANLIATNPAAQMHGFMLDETQPTATLTFDEITIQIDTEDPSGTRATTYPGYGLAIQDDDGIFIIGRGFWATPVAPAGSQVSFLSAEQYRLQDGQLVLHRRLNGDETAGGTSVPFPFAGSAMLPNRVIPTRLPDTGVARIVLYNY